MSSDSVLFHSFWNWYWKVLFDPSFYYTDLSGEIHGIPWFFVVTSSQFDTSSLLQLLGSIKSIQIFCLYLSISHYIIFTCLINIWYLLIILLYPGWESAHWPVSWAPYEKEIQITLERERERERVVRDPCLLWDLSVNWLRYDDMSAADSLLWLLRNILRYFWNLSLCCLYFLPLIFRNHLISDR